MKEGKITFEDILEEANNGDAQAQGFLGMCYLEGINIDKSPEEGVKWLRLSAEQNFPMAIGLLGLCYANGDGVKQSYEESIKWFRKGVELDDETSLNSLGYAYAKGQGVPQSHEKAAELYRKAAEHGLAPAQYNLANCYDTGEGVPQSYEEALKWYRLAADQGDAPSQSEIGAFYALGKGVPQSDEEAVKWFRLAADKGYKNGQYNLGFCYFYGKGVEEDKTEALKWIRMSAEQDDKAAIDFLKNLHDVSDVESRIEYLESMLEAVGIDPEEETEPLHKIVDLLREITDDESFLEKKQRVLDRINKDIADFENLDSDEDDDSPLVPEGPKQREVPLETRQLVEKAYKTKTGRHFIEKVGLRNFDEVITLLEYAETEEEYQEYISHLVHAAGEGDAQRVLTQEQKDLIVRAFYTTEEGRNTLNELGGDINYVFELAENRGEEEFNQMMYNMQSWIDAEESPFGISLKNDAVKAIVFKVIMGIIGLITALIIVSNIR